MNVDLIPIMVYNTVVKFHIKIDFIKMLLSILKVNSKVEKLEEFLMKSFLKDVTYS